MLWNHQLRQILRAGTKYLVGGASFFCTLDLGFIEIGHKGALFVDIRDYHGYTCRLGSLVHTYSSDGGRNKADTVVLVIPPPSGKENSLQSLEDHRIVSVVVIYLYTATYTLLEAHIFFFL